jgi:hypothetical protein
VPVNGNRPLRMRRETEVRRSRRSGVGHGQWGGGTVGMRVGESD